MALLVVTFPAVKIPEKPVSLTAPSVFKFAPTLMVNSPDVAFSVTVPAFGVEVVKGLVRVIASAVAVKSSSVDTVARDGRPNVKSPLPIPLVMPTANAPVPVVLRAAVPLKSLFGLFKVIPAPVTLIVISPLPVVIVVPAS